MQISLRLPGRFKLGSKEQESNWSNIAENMYVPFDGTYKFHPEYDGFKYSGTY